MKDSPAPYNWHGWLAAGIAVGALWLVGTLIPQPPTTKVAYVLRVWEPKRIEPHGRRTTNYDAAGHVIGYSETDVPEPYYSTSEGWWVTLREYTGSDGHERPHALAECRADRTEYIRANPLFFDDSTFMGRLKTRFWVQCARERALSPHARRDLLLR